MQNVEEIEAGILELMEEMEGEHGDAHEIYMRLRQILDGMRAMGMPVPEDLARMEKSLSEEFVADAEDIEAVRRRMAERVRDDGRNDGG